MDGLYGSKGSFQTLTIQPKWFFIITQYLFITVRIENIFKLSFVVFVLNYPCSLCSEKKLNFKCFYYKEWKLYSHALSGLETVWSFMFLLSLLTIK